MTDAILGIGLVSFSASLWLFARAFRYNPITAAPDEKIITRAQWDHLRQRAADERGAATPPRGSP